MELKVQKVVGLEIANSSVKVVSNNKVITYSNTIKEVADSEIDTALNYLKDKMVYRIKTKRFVVGVSNGTGSGGKDRDYASEQFRTEAAIALSNIVQTENELLKVVTGTPATENKDYITKDIEKNLLGKYEVWVNDVRKTFEVESVLVLPQPVGTLFSMVYDMSGNRKPIVPGTDGKTDHLKNILVIDIGWGTTDLVELNLSNGIGNKYTINRAMSDYNLKMLELIDNNFKNSDVRSMYPQTYDLDKILRDSDELPIRGGCVSVKGLKQQLQKEFAKNILDSLMNNGFDFGKYHIIALTGGGCTILEHSIRNIFPEKYKNDILLVDDAVMANAKGFYIFGRKKFGI